MNPLAILGLRGLAVLIVLAGLWAWLHHRESAAADEGYKRGRGEVLQAWDKQRELDTQVALQATERNREIERQMARTRLEAERVRETDRTTLVAADGRAGAELAGLRDELAAARSRAAQGGGPGGDPAAACDRRVAELGADLGQVLADVLQSHREATAAHADRTSQVRQLRDEWPRVMKPPAR